MDRWTISHMGFERPDGAWGEGPTFAVADTTGQHVATVNAAVGMSDAGPVLGYLGEQHPEQDEEAAIKGFLIPWALTRLEAALADPAEVERLAAAGHTRWLFTEADIDPADAMSREKHCDWQVGDGRSLYCSASTDQDETAVGTSGLTVLAPTTRNICRACTLPDGRMLCTHLHHPRVDGFWSMDSMEPERQAMTAMCDLGKDANNGTQCQPGGKPCWQRVVEAAPPIDAPAVTALALPEAFEVLDTAWRAAFRSRLLNAPSPTVVVGMTQDAESPDEFRARVDDLANVIDQMQPAKALKPGDVKEESDDWKGHLKRIETILRDRGVKDAYDLMSPLHAVMNLRHGFTHHGQPRRAMPEHAARLGIRQWPPSDWPDALRRVRSGTVVALTRLRRAITELADGEL